MADTPVVGMPTLREYTVVSSWTCSCEDKNTLLVSGRPGAMFGCAACQQVYRIEAQGIDAKTGQLEIVLAKIAMPTLQGAH